MTRDCHQSRKLVYSK